MKAVTLWEPWASLVAIGAKPYEFRKWAAPGSIVGDRIAIHAGVRKVVPAEVRAIIMNLRGSESGRAALRPEIALPFLDRLLLSPGLARTGMVVATAKLGRPVRSDRIMSEFGVVLNDSDRAGHFNFAWPLLDVEEMRPPIEARGAQGFWEWMP